MNITDEQLAILNGHIQAQVYAGTMEGSAFEDIFNDVDELEVAGLMFINIAKNKKSITVMTTESGLDVIREVSRRRYRDDCLF